MVDHQISPAQFQNFDEQSDKSAVVSRVTALRGELSSRDLDAYLVPRADVFRGESVPPSEERLAYLTAFTGSAGMAIITEEKAVLFVDGRYTDQAPQQTDTAIFDIVQVPQNKPGDWIKSSLAQSAKIAFDPWLHTPAEIKKLKAELGEKFALVPCENLVEKIWLDRPAPPMSPVEIHGPNRAGKSVDQKLQELRQALADQKTDALVLNVPESICWLFNIRGRDVPHTPVTHAFAIVPTIGMPTLFIAHEKLDGALKDQILAFSQIEPPEDFAPHVAQLGENGKLVWMDPATAPFAAAESIENSGGKTHLKSDPTHDARIIKNEVELAGMREAHQRDGVALVNFLSWFDQKIDDNETLTEIQIATALEHFRKLDETLVDISFDTISGAGPNAAIIHYRVTENSNRALRRGELHLLDSGAQYLSGTTDITRTLYSGETNATHKEHFTRVLKGMISLSDLKFPKGTTGGQIDIIARKALWDAGLNYEHGTGHGVGAFLGVHETPPGIAPRYTMALDAGMILSNEPGYYKSGSHGIRIENLISVKPWDEFEGFLQFETLTLAPIEKRLIETQLLSEAERNWLNAYHQRVHEEISPHLDSAETKSWLAKATSPL